MEQNKEKYEKALEIAINELQNSKTEYSASDVQKMLLNMFPDAKTYADEKTKKSLLEFLETIEKCGKNTDLDRWSKADCANWIFWLNKQRTCSEQTEAICTDDCTTNYEDDELSVGDWIIDKLWGAVRRIISYSASKGIFLLWDPEEQAAASWHTKSYIDVNCRKWDINDAKPGDILSTKFEKWEKIVLVVGCGQDGVKGYGITIQDGILVHKGEKTPILYSNTWTSTLTPATLKQTKYLFEVFSAYGFKWNANQKEEDDSSPCENKNRKTFEPCDCDEQTENIYTENCTTRRNMLTIEQRKIVKADICTRLPYCPKFHYFKEDVDDCEYDDELSSFDVANDEVTGEDHYEEPVSIDSICLYLRKVSDITEEEMDKLFEILNIEEDKTTDWIKINDDLGIKFFFPTGRWIENVAEAYDYLNSIHIDYRGLIAKKLALEAPKDMYN